MMFWIVGLDPPNDAEDVASPGRWKSIYSVDEQLPGRWMDGAEQYNFLYLVVGRRRVALRDILLQPEASGTPRIVHKSSSRFI